MPINLSSGKDYDTRENIPTLRQYLNSLGNKKLAQRYLVTVIWKPNQFSNYTFETECFRVRIKSNSSLGKALSECFGEWEETEPVLAIQVTDRDNATFAITSLDTERASWEGLGETGWKLTVLPKK